MADGRMRRLRRWGQRNYLGLAVSGMVFLLVVIYFAPLIFISIPAGHAGVMWLRLMDGTVTSWHFEEGLKVIPPWDKIIKYDLRLRTMTAQIDALSEDGLSVTVSVSARYRVKPDVVGHLHKQGGPNYEQTLILPSLAAQVRHVVAARSPAALYSMKRAKLEKMILKGVIEGVSKISDAVPKASRFIRFEDILIRSVVLPERVRNAIMRKNVHRHRMEQYKYILKRERMESRRKAIEAAGVRAFQETVSSGISDRYLTWKGIDATMKLAESNNSKVVVIGAGDKGLPLILGDWASRDTTAGAAATGASGDGGADGGSETGEGGTRIDTGGHARIPRLGTELVESATGDGGRDAEGPTSTTGDTPSDKAPRFSRKLLDKLRQETDAWIEKLRTGSMPGTDGSGPGATDSGPAAGSANDRNTPPNYNDRLDIEPVHPAEDN